MSESYAAKFKELAALYHAALSSYDSSRCPDPEALESQLGVLEDQLIDFIFERPSIGASGLEMEAMVSLLASNKLMGQSR